MGSRRSCADGLKGRLSGGFLFTHVAAQDSRRSCTKATPCSHASDDGRASEGPGICSRALSGGARAAGLGTVDSRPNRELSRTTVNGSVVPTLAFFRWLPQHDLWCCAGDTAVLPEPHRRARVPQLCWCAAAPPSAQPVAAELTGLLQRQPLWLVPQRQLRLLLLSAAKRHRGWETSTEMCVRQRRCRSYRPTVSRSSVPSLLTTPLPLAVHGSALVVSRYWALRQISNPYSATSLAMSPLRRCSACRRFSSLSADFCA